MAPVSSTYPHCYTAITFRDTVVLFSLVVLVTYLPFSLITWYAGVDGSIHAGGGTWYECKRGKG